MIPYTETSVFNHLVARARSNIEALSTERERLRAIKRKDRSAEQHRRFEALVGLVRTQQGKLKRLLTLESKPWYLLHFLMEAELQFWTTVEREMWHKTLALNEGRGEQALRIRHGLPPEPSKEACDLVKYVDGIRTLYEEVKNLQGRQSDGKFHLQAIQTGTTGREAYLKWVFEHAEIGMFVGLDKELRDALARGEITAGKLYHLPHHIMSSLLFALRPSQVLGSYDAIIGTTCNGFFRVPKADFDRAWSLQTVTKGGPKYTLRTEYVVERLKATLSGPARDGCSDAGSPQVEPASAAQRAPSCEQARPSA